jgi:hypothetical protein
MTTRPGSSKRRWYTARLFRTSRVGTGSPHSGCSRGAGKREERRRRLKGNGIIEVEIDGVTIRVGAGADVKTVAAVIRALKAVT